MTRDADPPPAGAPASERIGWIGLGSIGTPMVRRLLEAGYPVAVHPRGAGLEDVLAAGAQAIDGYPALAAASDLLALCVYSDDQLTDILFERGALAAMQPGSALIVHTTGSPETIMRIARQAPAGVAVLDACFSGGPAEAAAGTLTLMVGGEAAALARVRPVIGHYAVHIHAVGPVGSGQTIKLLNNLLFAANLMHAGEALRLATERGLSPAIAAEVIGDSSGASFAARLFAGGAPPAAMLRAVRPYLEKDVAQALSAAAAAGLDTAAFAATARYFSPAGQGERR